MVDEKQDRRIPKVGQRHTSHTEKKHLSKDNYDSNSNRIALHGGQLGVHSAIVESQAQVLKNELQSPITYLDTITLSTHISDILTLNSKEENTR